MLHTYDTIEYNTRFITDMNYRYIQSLQNQIQVRNSKHQADLNFLMVFHISRDAGYTAGKKKKLQVVF